jgi:XTP/dITP diphosphohydrolase
VIVDVYQGSGYSKATPFYPFRSTFKHPTSYMHVVLGTSNLAKGRELEELLQPWGFAVQTLQNFENPLDVIEDGETFAENARKKASEQATHLNRWVLADDSGLVVDALKGAPGIYSARFAGESATDADNNSKLIQSLADTPLEKRSAHYYCHVALSDPKGQIRAECWGICRGRIRLEAAGSNGFGYDPLFEVIEYHRTFGQLGGRVKSALSHRARAMRGIVPQLVAISATIDSK